MLRKLVPRSTYARNVITLMTGTAFAQALPIAVSPILTRLYTPEEFGLAALYLSCVAVMSLIATGRYELAITLPASDEDAAHIVTFTIQLSVLISSLLYLPIFFFDTTIAQWLGNSALAPWLYLLPISVLTTSSFNIFQYWCNRKSQYRMMSNNRMQNAVFSTALNIALGLAKIPGSMILGPAMGQALAAILIGRKGWIQNKNLLSGITRQAEKSMAKRYIDHPKYLAPAQLLGTVAVQIPVFMIGSVYSLGVLGFFSMAYRMVTLPSGLIAGAIGDVYRQRISVAYAECGEFRSIFVSTLRKTTLLALPPFVVIYFIAPILFEWVFGAAWRVAGEYAQILVVAAFFQFVFTPIDKGSVVVGATRYILAWHVTRLMLFMLLFYISKNYELEIKNALWIFVFSNSFLYFVEGFFGYWLAGKNAR